MIGKKVKVHSGKHAGKTGTIINNIHPQNAWKVRRDGKSGETFQVSKNFVEFVILEAPTSTPPVRLESTEDRFLGKWVTFNTARSIETSRDEDNECDMRALITDVWREDGVWLANAVFMGEYAVFDVDKADVNVEFSQRAGGSRV